MMPSITQWWYRLQSMLAKQKDQRLVLQTRNSTVTLQEAGIPYEEIIILYLMGTFEAIFICGNSVTILIISLFVSNVFLKVVRKTSGIKDRTRPNVQWSSLTFHHLQVWQS